MNEPSPPDVAVTAADFLISVHRLSITEAEHLNFNKQHAWHRTLVQFYGSLVELSHALHAVFTVEAYIAIPSIFRSLLEAYVDFINLVQNPKYGYYLDYAYYTQWLKLLDAAESGRNAFLASISDDAMRPWFRRTLENALSELVSKGYKKGLDNVEKFRMAGMEAEYRSLYNFLCCDSHNNIRALIGRHIEFDDDNQSFELAIHRERKTGEFAAELCQAAKLLADAGIRLHRALESGHAANIEHTLADCATLENQIAST